MKPLSVGLLSLWLFGCVTPGKNYDDSKVAAIKKGTTTEVELLDWFGPASSRSMGPDGSKIVTWRFAPRGSGTMPSPSRLEVRFDTDGKLIAYAASSGTK